MRPGDVVDWLVQLYATGGQAAYLGEAVSQLEHALQTAWRAEQDGADSALIAAALLHDLGHLLDARAIDPALTPDDHQHEELAARWLAGHFGPDVGRPIQLHVAAKRYLCATEPSYLDRLSPASVASLKLQGGPMSAAEVAAFEVDPHHRAAVRLRRWDDEAKVPHLATPPLEHFRPHLEAARRHAR